MRGNRLHNRTMVTLRRGKLCDLGDNINHIYLTEHGV